MAAKKIVDIIRNVIYEFYPKQIFNSARTSKEMGRTLSRGTNNPYSFMYKDQIFSRKNFENTSVQ